MKIDAKVRFIKDSSKYSPLTDTFDYIVPTRNMSLLTKEFGQLFREIIITIMLSLTKKRSVCIHSSSARYKNKAILFIGESGVGKSTICKLLAPEFTQLTDDATFLEKKDMWVTSPLPIFEKHAPLSERNATLIYEVKALCFLKQGKMDRLSLIHSKDSLFKETLKNIIFTGSKEELESILALSNSKTLDFYRLEFTKGRVIKALLEEEFS